MAGTINKQLSSTAQADGTAMSDANSGFSSHSTGSGNTATHSDAAKMAESAGYRLTQGGANPNIWYLDHTAAVDKFAWRIPFNYSATPTANVTILRGYADAAHVTTMWSISITTTNRISFVETGTGGLNVSSSAASPLIPGSDYVMLGYLDTITHALTIQVYPRGSGTLLFQITATPVNSTAVRSVRWGIGTASSLGRIDTNSAFAIGQDGLLARTDFVSNVPPIANAGPDQVVGVNTLVTLTGSDSDPDGTVVTRSWSQISGPTVTLSGSGNARTFTPTTSGTYVFQYSVTDDGGATTNDSVTVLVDVELTLRNNAEGGTNGTAVTTGNSGGASGDAFSVVTPGSGNTFIFDNVGPLVDALSLKMVQAGANQCFIGWTWSGARPRLYALFLMRFDALPLVSNTFLRGFSDAGYATNVFSVAVTNTGKIQVINTANNANAASSGSLAAGTDYVIAISWESGNTLTAEAYPLGSSVAVPNTSVSVAASSASINSLRAGIIGTSTGLTLRWEITLSSLAMPARPDVALTATLLASSVAPEAGQIVTITATPSGPVTGRTWRIAAITNGVPPPALQAGADADQKIMATPTTLDGCQITVAYLPASSGGTTVEAFLNIVVLAVTTLAGASKKPTTAIVPL